MTIATDSGQPVDCVGILLGVDVQGYDVVRLQTPRDAAFGFGTPPPVPVEARPSSLGPSALIEPGMVAGSRVTAAHAASPR